MIKDTVVMDLNGDGVEETLEYHVVDGDNEYAYIAIAGTDTVFAPKDYFFNTDMFTVDVDGDGKIEIFLYGDVASDDYYTYVTHYENGTFVELSAPDINRGINTDAYNPYVYGYVVGIGENTVRFSGTQDVLGTYAMERTLALVSNRFEIADDGMWIRSDAGDDVWEYQGLTLLQELTLTAEDGSDIVLHPGEKILPIASDKVSVVQFTTEDSRVGTAEYAFSEDEWVSYVNGISERELFEAVHYAD